MAAPGPVPSASGRRVQGEIRGLRRMQWLLAGIALLLTLVLALGAVHALNTDAKQALASAMQDNERLARALEEHVVHTFMNADQLVLSVKRQVENRGLPEDLREFVDERTLPGTPFLVTLIADAQGNSVRHTYPGRAINVADVAHFKSAQQEDTGKLLIGEPIVGRLSGKWSLHVARRLNRPDGSFGGIASVALDQSYVARLYARVSLGSAGIVVLVGTDGIVRAHHGASGENVGAALQSADLRGRIAESPNGSFVAPAADGQPERLLAYRALEKYPLVVVVGTSAAAALAQFAEHKRDLVVGVVLVGALIWSSFGLLGWLMLRERRAALRLQEANRRTEAANRVKSDFLANMTHELRTPLDGIIGCADSLQAELEDPNQRECARIIHSSGRALLGMVSSVLDMAKIQAGAMTLETSVEPLRPLLDELAMLHAPVAERKGLTFALSVAPDAPVTIACDRTKLVQILNNLLNNAIRFTEQGRVSLSARRDDDGLTIAVRDTGCGVPSALHETIFERFNQGERAGAGLQGGTGLGLALARDLAHLMGGRIDVDSRPGEGAAFRVWLPLEHGGGR